MKLIDKYEELHKKSTDSQEYLRWCAFRRYILMYHRGGPKSYLYWQMQRSAGLYGRAS